MREILHFMSSDIVSQLALFNISIYAVSGGLFKV